MSSSWVIQPLKLACVEKRLPDLYSLFSSNAKSNADLNTKIVSKAFTLSIVNLNANANAKLDVNGPFWRRFNMLVYASVLKRSLFKFTLSAMRLIFVSYSKNNCFSFTPVCLHHDNPSTEEIMHLILLRYICHKNTVISESNSEGNSLNYN